MSTDHPHPTDQPPPAPSQADEVLLSVIIVNYNVQYFLEQCLHSARQAATKVATEIIVIDNNSVDGSDAMVREKFPEVNYIYNHENLGFSRANNQGIRLSKGKYVLLLNPDTVVEEDTFASTVAYMETHPDTGGLGVKMLDGKGEFLPESKRGLPRPRVAFYKIFGLSALFPKSKRFGQYHLSFLDPDEVHEIEVLSGAFMLMRKEALDKVGLLDEAFFMYGEDIDLSYRITQGGYKNVYFPHTRIIHYKGESTKKSSINYVFVFYNAMVIFARKHFTQQHANTFSLLINLAIYFRAGIAILQRFLQWGLPALLDLALLLPGLTLITTWYSNYSEKIYPDEMLQIALPAYSLTWIAAIYLNGGYDKPVRLNRIARGVLWGTGVILVAYALLSEDYRFSRAVILMGTGMALASAYAIRLLLHLLPLSDFKLAQKVKKRMAIVASEPEIDRITGLLNQTGVQPEFVAFINPDSQADNTHNRFLTGLDKLDEAMAIFRISEVIFSGKDLPAQRIIGLMAALGHQQREFKIAPPNSGYIIGSNSINAPGELYSILNVNAISRPSRKRGKRLFDLLSSLLLLVTLPLNIWAVGQKGQYLVNLFAVLFGKKSWVSYIPFSEGVGLLPKVKAGILHPLDGQKNPLMEAEKMNKANLEYARDFHWTIDLSVLLRGFASLGRNAKVK